MNMLFPIVTQDVQLLPFYLTSIGMKDNQNPIQRTEGYPSYQLTCCLKGAGKLLISGKEYEIGEGMGFFFCPDIPHEYYATKEPWVTKWIAFDGQQLQHIFRLSGIGKYEVFSGPGVKEVSASIDSMYFMLQSDHSHRVLEVSVMLFSLVVKFGEWIDKHRDQSTRVSFNKLQRAIGYIEGNYNRNVSLDEIAAFIGVSPNFLCRIFKKSYSETPFKYLIKFRIQKAKSLLIRAPQFRIKDVAQMTGFNDTSYFCSVFKEQEGVTPNEFRELFGISPQ